MSLPNLALIKLGVLKIRSTLCDWEAQCATHTLLHGDRAAISIGKAVHLYCPEK
jgi:hypothetical protein